MFVALLATHILAQTASWSYTSTPGPLTNPLKGWVPFVGEGTRIHQPYSTVYFNVTWRELEPQQGSYRFEEWEKRMWEIPQAKGKHIVFRVNMDYPGDSTGVPQWLINQGIKMTPYTDHGGGKSPDYGDARLQKSLLEFVKALGARYDKNPRVAFLQVGLLGFWGEWHTWPRTEMFAPEPFQRQVLEAMTAAFPSKKLMARDPSGAAGRFPGLGYHDDMIPEDTLGAEEWKFLPGLQRNGKGTNWDQFPRGGEMVPGASRKYVLDEFPLTLQAIKDVHFSWIGPYCPALTQIDDQRFGPNCETLLRTMGYQFSLSKASATLSGGTCAFTVEGVNQGVAPFYYPWRVRLALLNAKGEVAAQADTGIDIRKWMPGKFKEAGNVKLKAPEGKYRLALGVIDPYLLKPSIEFANSFDKVDGWQVLGQVQISSK